VTDQDILDAINSVAAEHLDAANIVTLDAKLVETLELDSIRLLTLVVELENHFQICLEEGDEDGVETGADLVALLRTRLHA
jgi:acyl carrier protein